MLSISNLHLLDKAKRKFIARLDGPFRAMRVHSPVAIIPNTFSNLLLVHSHNLMELIIYSSALCFIIGPEDDRYLFGNG